MDGTEGLVRGQPVSDTGYPIRIPVGQETLGRIINVIGEPIDERGPIKTDQYVNFLILCNESDNECFDQGFSSNWIILNLYLDHQS